MRSSLTYVSLATLLIAIVAWVAVWFFTTDLSARITEHAQALSSSNIQDAQQANAIQLHAIAEDTASNRATLDQFVGTDVVGIANQLQSAGQAAGTKTIIGSANPGAALNAQAGVTPLEFVVQSTGTFAQVWRAAELFETLPLPSSVEELDFQQIPDSSGQDAWQLTAHISVLTSAKISS